jgi:hypothetical protein
MVDRTRRLEKKPVRTVNKGLAAKGTSRLREPPCWKNHMTKSKNHQNR